jgi:putative ABC transport system ATP-binding protein
LDAAEDDPMAQGKHDGNPDSAYALSRAPALAASNGHDARTRDVNVASVYTPAAGRREASGWGSSGACEALNELALYEVIKHYAAGEETVRAVDGVSLTVKAGELVALYGPSGSGKTTLLLIVAALLAPDSGSVRFGGRQIDGLSAFQSAHFRRREVGFVFQSFHLLAGASALDNAALGVLCNGHSLGDARTLVRPWLCEVGLEGRMQHKAAQLSMGERQRVAIARALASEPRLLLADEPTGNLDSRRTQEILALLRNICHERGIPGLLVTHDLRAQPFMDQVHTLRDGHLSEGLDAELASSLGR